MTDVVPVWEGHVVKAAIGQLGVAGAALTDKLMDLLLGKGVALSRAGDREVVANIKQNMCCVLR